MLAEEVETTQIQLRALEEIARSPDKTELSSIQDPKLSEIGPAVEAVPLSTIEATVIEAQSTITDALNPPMDLLVATKSNPDSSNSILKETLQRKQTFTEDLKATEMFQAGISVNKNVPQIVHLSQNAEKASASSSSCSEALIKTQKVEPVAEASLSELTCEVVHPLEPLVATKYEEEQESEQPTAPQTTENVKAIKHMPQADSEKFRFKIQEGTVSSRTRRASRGDTKLLTITAKGIRSLKKPKHEKKIKAFARQKSGVNLEIEEQFLQMDPPQATKNGEAEPSKANFQISLAPKQESLSLHDNLTPITLNPDSTLSGNDLLTNDPSKVDTEDTKSLPVPPHPLESIVGSAEESDELDLFDKMDDQPELKASSLTFIQDSLQECSSGASTPIKSRSDSAHMPWLGSAQYKTWKKLAQMVLKEVAHHRLAPIFQRPIKESLAPGYYSIVKRPMDLSTIQSRIKNGGITTTEEFTRDILLMCQNALMFNRGDTEIHGMAREMLASVQFHLETLRAASLCHSTAPQHSTSSPPSPPLQ
ncbi:hypothetical protein L0F63_003900 [Massospora cicadina]|nr:hypothetical protein L0F63_003900 [Massospora cicadina]